MGLRRHVWRDGPFGVVFVLLLGLLGGLSCAGVPEEDTAPPSEQPEDVPAVDWIADGNVTPGEYADTLDEGTYRLHWVSTADTIRVAIDADTSGWVAIGLQPGNRMKDADIVLGMVSDGKAIVIDSYSTGDFGPHSADSELGGSDDLLEYAARESDGMTVVEFERAFDTGDAFDVVLQHGVAMRIIWAYGSTDSEGVKHSTRGYGELVP